MKPRQLKIKAKVSSKTKFEKKLKRRDAPKRLKSSNKKDVNKHKHSQQINLVNWRLETDVAPDHMDADEDDNYNKESSDIEENDGEYMNSVEQKYALKKQMLSNCIEKEEKIENYEEDEDEIEIEKPNEKKVETKTIYNNLAGKSAIEQLSIIKNLKAELKQEVASICNKIMLNPESNLNKVKELFLLLDQSVTDSKFGPIFYNVQQTVIGALCVLFVDIIPNYRLAERINFGNTSDPDGKNNRSIKDQKLKRETIKTFIYEKSMIQYYKLYIDRLVRIIDSEFSPIERRSNFYRIMLKTSSAKRNLVHSACFCFSELLSSHYNFNYRSEVIRAIVRVLCNTNRSDEMMRKICFHALTNFFKVDKLGDASSEAIVIISEYVKKQNFRVSPAVFQIFISLNFQELSSENSRQLNSSSIRSKVAKKDRKQMSRKERKQSKHYGKLEKELLEAEAVEDRTKRYSFKLSIHKQIFELYFRFVKRCLEIDSLSNDMESNDFNQWYRPLFVPLFDGMAKHSIYLNEDYINELINMLLKMIDSESSEDRSSLSTNERLCCLKTITQILNQTENLLQLDYENQYSILYQICMDPSAIEHSIDMLLQCIDEMIIKRFKTCPMRRINSFIQRLILVSLYVSSPVAASLLAVVKRLLQQHQFAIDTLFGDIDADIDQWVGMEKLSELNQNLDLNINVRESNSIIVLNRLIASHCNPHVRMLAYSIITHFSTERGKFQCISENNSIHKFINEHSLSMDFCCKILRSNSPIQVYNLVNVERIKLEQVFSYLPKFKNKNKA